MKSIAILGSSDRVTFLSKDILPPKYIILTLKSRKGSASSKQREGIFQISLVHGIYPREAIGGDTWSSVFSTNIIGMRKISPGKEKLEMELLGLLG